MSAEQDDADQPAEAVEHDGDLAYMLETGLLEELKPGEGDDKPVDEYRDQVTDALFEALTMP